VGCFNGSRRSGCRYMKKLSLIAGSMFPGTLQSKTQKDFTAPLFPKTSDDPA